MEHHLYVLSMNTASDGSEAIAVADTIQLCQHIAARQLVTAGRDLTWITSDTNSDSTGPVCWTPDEADGTPTWHVDRVPLHKTPMSGLTGMPPWPEPNPWTVAAIPPEEELARWTIQPGNRTTLTNGSRITNCSNREIQVRQWAGGRWELDSPDLLQHAQPDADLAVLMLTCNGTSTGEWIVRPRQGVLSEALPGYTPGHPDGG
jgi:hypothetical protein